MFSHTPGPWTVNAMNVANIDGEKINRFPISGGGMAIASVWAGDARRSGNLMGLQDLHGANANLIAAAPDLYAALSALNSEIMDSDERAVDLFTPHTIDLMRAAIAKARGL